MNTTIRTMRTPSCPYFGTREDREVCYSYPSPENRCYRCRVPAAPMMLHQQAYCLCGAQKDCPVYLQDQNRAFPTGIMAQDVQPATAFNSAPLLLSLAVILILAGFIAYQFLPQFRLLITGLRVPVGWMQGGSATSLPLMPVVVPSGTPSPAVGPACWFAANPNEPCTPLPPTSTLAPSMTPLPNVAATQACQYYKGRGTPCPP